jgi:hypothetical protein
MYAQKKYIFVIVHVKILHPHLLYEHHYVYEQLCNRGEKEEKRQQGKEKKETA